MEGLAGTVEEKEEEGFTEVSEAVQDAAVLEEVMWQDFQPLKDMTAGVENGVGDSQLLLSSSNPAQPKPDIRSPVQKGTV